MKDVRGATVEIQYENPAHREEACKHIERQLHEQGVFHHYGWVHYRTNDKQYPYASKVHL